MSSDPSSDVLDVVLKKTQDKAWVAFAPDELSALLSAFSPTQPVATHTKGYLVLSAYCQRRRSEAPSHDEGTQSISRTFETPVVSRMADTEEEEALAGLTFLSALFDVDHPSASAIFQRDGTLEAMMDTLDLFPKSHHIDLAVAHLLGRTAGHKTCRALLGKDHRNWLEWKSRQTNDAELRAAAAVALVKLARGSSADAMEVGGTPEQPAMQDDELAALMKGLVVDAQETSSLADAVEGLAYMSTNPAVKETLSKDSTFLQRLFALIPRRKGATSERLDESTASPLYGTVVIISNLCAYRPRLSAEEAQIAKLRRMAKTAKGPGQSSQAAEEDLDPVDDDDHVKERGRRLIKAGAMEALTSAVRATDSRAVRMAVSKAILNLVEDKDNRGKVLQSGGAKALQIIIQGLLPQSKPSDIGKTPQLEKEDFEPIQALAKLAITAAPVQVFGPNEGAIYDAIRPFALMLTHPNATLLQSFEAMMALTNLSSQSPEAASRIAGADGLMNKVELLMLEDHTLVRRAATELVCNLVAGSEEIFNKWGGDRNTASKSKLQVLVALCDIEDLPTRLAASGALASLTASPDACESLAELESERHHVLPILGQLVDPTVVARPEADADVEEEEAGQLESDPGLVHRGIVCLRNFFVGLQNSATQMEIASEADRTGVVRALVGVVKGCAQNPSSPILRPAAEALKWLLEHGVEISV
ncbi:ARM repeat-containing protein [Lentinus tigrinus ALCF2SS1-6]|uniref:ARM repeat-containing protein n=1 Tax=Lentinus tigrinus ALCF2SS1-6 TaxID=1328759 RepID=A0A5C2S2Q6_9APHY|nr:ARM repeat-containing protein [Lentinus tigrinus ALCF2SS1-6]